MLNPRFRHWRRRPYRILTNRRPVLPCALRKLNSKSRMDTKQMRHSHEGVKGNGLMGEVRRKHRKLVCRERPDVTGTEVGSRRAFCVSERLATIK